MSARARTNNAAATDQRCMASPRPAVCTACMQQHHRSSTRRTCRHASFRLPIDRERLDSDTHMHAARWPVNLLLLLSTSK
jgi:hypothetical protein